MHQTGDDFGFFRLQEVIRSGAFDTVYRAAVPALQCNTALRVTRPFDSYAPEDLQQLLALGPLLSQQTHPSILPLTECGEMDGALYYSSQFAETDSCHDIAPLEVNTAVQVVASLAEAVQFAHDQWGVVHGDINPMNVFFKQSPARVSRREPLLLSACFTLCEWTQVTSRASTSLSLSTPFMSPEQCASPHAIDIRSDIFSLGKLLCYLTGCDEQAVSDAKAVAQLLGSAHLGAIVAKSVAAEPAERYASAIDLSRDLIAVFS